MSKEPINAPTSSRAEIDTFLNKHAMTRGGHGGQARLIFSVDATASREPTWDQSATLTAAMFEAVTSLSVQLDVQLAFYRGAGSTSVCKASRWTSDSRVLAGLMSKVRCDAGETQLLKVVNHAQRENARQKVQALVFVGDAFEENPDTVCAAAKQLGCPAFMFQEGNDRHAAKVFADIARLTGGAYCRFDQGAARQLAELLGAVATYVAGGQQALEKLSATNAGAIRLLQQLR